VAVRAERRQSIPHPRIPPERRLSGRQGSSIAPRTRSGTRFATFAIAAGIPTFEIARMMGSSIEQIDKTYGHLLPDSLDRARTALDSFLVDEADEAFGH
jgi:hypothetical protein